MTTDVVRHERTQEMSFSDALILSVAEEHSCPKFVIWNVKLFESRTDISCENPRRDASIIKL